MLNEKRRRRRESHNAVERRRRDNINEKIQELSSLLPEIPTEGTNKLNKGVILRRSVEYVRGAQRLMMGMESRLYELESALKRVCDVKGIDINSLGLSAPLGSGPSTNDLIAVMTAAAASSSTPSLLSSPPTTSAISPGAVNMNAILQQHQQQHHLQQQQQRSNNNNSGALGLNVTSSTTMNSLPSSLSSSTRGLKSVTGAVDNMTLE